jgi:hypothetical protein
LNLLARLTGLEPVAHGLEVRLFIIFIIFTLRQITSAIYITTFVILISKAS